MEFSPAVFFCCDGQRCWSLSASLLPAVGASTSYIACQTSAQITLLSSCAHSACSTSSPPTASIRSAQFMSLCVTAQRWRWGKRRHSASHSDGVHVLMGHYTGEKNYWNCESDAPEENVAREICFFTPDLRIFTCYCVFPRNKDNVTCKMTTTTKTIQLLWWTSSFWKFFGGPAPQIDFKRRYLNLFNPKFWL